MGVEEKEKTEDERKMERKDKGSTEGEENQRRVLEGRRRPSATATSPTPGKKTHFAFCLLTLMFATS